MKVESTDKETGIIEASKQIEDNLNQLMALFVSAHSAGKPATTSESDAKETVDLNMKIAGLNQ